VQRDTTLRMLGGLGQHQHLKRYAETGRPIVDESR